MRRPAVRQESAQGAVTALAPLLDRSIARDLAGAVAGENRLAFARSFTFRVAAAYAASLHPARNPLPMPDGLDLGPLSREAEAAAMQLGGGLAGIPAAEAAYLLGCIYTSALPADFRAAMVFSTPRPKLSGTPSTWPSAPAPIGGTRAASIRLLAAAPSSSR